MVHAQAVLAFEVLQTARDGSEGQGSIAEAEQIAKRYTQRLTQALSLAPKDHPAAAVLLQSALRLYEACDTEGWTSVLRVVGPQLPTAVAALQPVVLAVLGAAMGGAGGDNRAAPQELEVRIAQYLNGGVSAEPCDGPGPTQWHLVITWLRAVCLPTISSDAHSAVSAMAVDTSPGVSGASGGGKRKRTQDAESFDFFDEGDSDSDAYTAAAHGVGGGGGSASRKRLKKRSASSPAPTTTVGRGSASATRPVAFEQSLLEGQLMILVEQDLIGSALLVLTSRHRTQTCISAQKKQEPEKGAVEGSLHEAVHEANCAALLLSVASAPLAPQVVSALSAVLGMCCWMRRS